MSQSDTKDSSQSLNNRSFNPNFGMYEVIAYGDNGDGTISAISTDKTINQVLYATETTLESIKSTDGIKKITDPIKIEHLSGTGVDTSYTLTNAGTAYYIPRTPPTARYTLIVYNGSDTDMMLGFSSTTTVGFKLVPGEKFMIDLDASELIYAYCASAGKVINFSYKEVV